MPNTPPESARHLTASAGRWRERFAPRRLAGYLPAILGGAAGALAYEPLAWKPLIVLAPLGIFMAVRRAATPGAAFRRALAGGWFFYFGVLQWLTSIREFAPVPALAVLGVAALALYLACYPALGAWAVRRWCWTRGPGMQFTLFAAAWLLGEWLRTLGRLAMPLGELGHAWATWPLAIQPAHFLGELGVSFEILWLAGLIFYWGLYAATRRQGAAADRPTLSHGIVPLLLFPIWCLTSLLLLAAWDARVRTQAEEGTGRPLTVALVQPNIDQWTKLASYASPDPVQQADLQLQITTLMEQMTGQEALRGRDLIVLPETAFTQWDFNTNAPLLGRIGAMARRADAPILAGASRVVEHGTSEDVFNSAYLFHRNGRLDNRVYDKMRLVPFGETLPYFDLIPGFQESIVGIGSFTAGRAQTLFSLDAPTTATTPRFGVLICFESTFAAAARGLARAGADFLVVVTNDGWYGLTAGAAAHHHLSLLRAVETRRYVLRCANTGISSIIDPTGRAIESLALDRRGVVVGTIYPELGARPSFYARRGNVWLIAPALLLAGAAFAVRRRNRAA